ncbi:hypothetical protein Bca52824_046391 [Brassica carinata]|uniref:Replication factor A C-terminal domain-containing protein n=1 Tax=Brassica carinata TaxID=52824 RepID=A0A8X7UQ56_BRACI|nr:hypothetical protein Bca52824_046391 [Brassica carinata]
MTHLLFEGGGGSTIKSPVDVLPQLRRLLCQPPLHLAGFQPLVSISWRGRCILNGFEVARCNPNFRLTDSSLLIRFSDATSLKVLTEPSSPLPEECFRFRSRSEMLALANTSSQLSDIIGEITAVRSFVSDPPGDKNHSTATHRLSLHMCALRQYICDWCSPGDNVKKGDDIPVDNTVPAEVETGGSSQQAAPDATAVPNGLNSPPGRCIPSPDLMSLDVLRILSYMPHRRKLILSAPGEVLDLTWTRGWCYVACSKFSKKLQSTVSAFECVRCSNGNAAGVLRYRVELAVADDTAEGAFVCFDGVMARLHKLRASEASQMLTEGVNPEDSKVPMFIIDMEGKVSTYNFTAHHQTFTITRILKEHERVPVPDFVVDGGTDGDDADLPDGSPVPVESEAGDDSSDAAVSADAKPANDATRKRTRASTKAVKKARVV